MKRHLVFATAAAFLAALVNVSLDARPQQAGATSAAARVTPAPPPAFDVLITPVAAGNAGQVSHVGVRLQIDWPAGSPPRPLALRIPVIFAGVPGIADGIEQLAAEDGEGRLELRQSQDAPDAGGFVYYRRWKSTRPVSGTAVVRYRARLPEARPRSGPPFDLRSNGGGVSGAGAGFLVLPDEQTVFRNRIRWDLSQLPAGSTAVSSLGEGDVQIAAPPDPLLASFYLAGPLGRFPASGASSGFSAAWLGTLPFDGEKTMKWASDSYSALSAFFKDPSPPPFRVFFRVGPDNVAPGGAQLTGSFLMFLPPHVGDHLGLRDTIVHEMAHRWGGSLEGPNGTVSWFGEGFATRYSSLVPLRAGLITPAEYLELVNRVVLRFYANPLRSLPNEQIASRFWSDRNAQTLPYDRGFMYFAHLDSRIRAASGGKRSVDTLLQSILEARRQGKPIDTAAWLEAVTRELGPSAKEDFDRIIVRAVPWDLESDAFGPCFAREATVYRPFELGFDEQGTLYTVPRVVKGLVPGSAAARAGLQNGDVLEAALELNRVRNHPDERLSFTVRRGTRQVTIDYVPRGEAKIPGYRWVPAPNAGAQCRAAR